MGSTTMALSSKPTVYRGDVAAEWRAAEGAYIRSLREERGLTQQDVADALGINNKQFISHVETGRVHIPTAAAKQLADFFKVDRKEFAQAILRWQSPYLYELLFGADSALKAELNRAKPRFQGMKRS